jgi:serine phosphatase RsbU (regulator of sigma subunit)
MNTKIGRKMLYTITELSEQPIYEQVSVQLIQKIIDDDLQNGFLLSSPGFFARRFKVSKNTIKRSYHYLENLGVIQKLNDSGYAVRNSDKIALGKLIEQISGDQTHQNSDSDLFENELTLAKEIQSGLLPKYLPGNDTFSVAAFTRPSKSIGGDFYDCFEIDDVHLGLIIADASGHGLPAALIISQIQAIIKTSLARTERLVDLINLLNRHLRDNTSARNFVTLFYGIYNTISGRCNYINAGHNRPIVIRNDGTTDSLSTTAPALGLTSDFKCTTRSVDLNDNEILIFYTDGITETMNSNHDEYTEERMIKLILENRDMHSEDLINLVQTDLKQFCPEGIFEDDQTLMIVKRN